MRDRRPLLPDQPSQLRIGFVVPGGGDGQESPARAAEVADLAIVPCVLQDTVAVAPQQVNFGGYHSIFAAGLPIAVMNYQDARFCHSRNSSGARIQRVSKPRRRRIFASRTMFPLVTLRITRRARAQ